MLRMRNFVLALLLLFTVMGMAQSPEAAIHKIFDSQIAAWDRGDLSGFMLGYWHAPELVFYSNSSETHGWQATLDRYRKSYQSEGKEMGTLDFPEMEIVPLGKDYALARGRWRLTMKSGKQLTGMTSLVLRDFAGEGWRIVFDHSSVE